MVKRGSKSPFHCALRSSEKSEWCWSVVFESESEDEAAEVERKAIASISKSQSLNIRLGGHYGGKYPDLPKDHPAKSHMRNRAGNPITEDRRNQMSTHSKVAKKFRKLSDDDIQYIRDNPDGLNQPTLARRFGVDQSYISRVRRGVKFKRHISAETWATLDYDFIMKNKGIITGVNLAKKFNTTVTVISWILNGHVKPPVS